MNMLEIKVKYRIALEKAIISWNYCNIVRISVPFAMALTGRKSLFIKKNISLLKNGRLDSHGNACYECKVQYYN